MQVNQPKSSTPEATTPRYCNTAKGELPQPLNYGALDPLQRLAVCRGTPLPAAADGHKEGVIDHV